MKKFLMLHILIIFMILGVKAQNKNSNNGQEKGTWVTYGDGSKRYISEKFDPNAMELNTYDQNYSEDTNWAPVKEDEFGFHIMNLFPKKLQFYIKTDSSFKEISILPFVFGQYYGVDSSTLTLYTKSIGFDGKEIFAPVISLDFPQNSKDAIFILSENSENKLTYQSYDISINAFPINSLAILNLSNKKIGIMVDKSKEIAQVMSLKIMKSPFDSQSETGSPVNICKYNAYDLSPNSKTKPHFGNLIFRKNKRCMMVYFEFSDLSTKTPIKIINAGPR